MTKLPWMKFYPADWRAHPGLRVCGLGARGLAIELLAIMHEAEPRGHLLLNRRPFPMQGADETCAKYRAKSYLDALKGFPAWAIDAARQDWINGRDLTGREDFQYAPAAPVFRKYAEKHAQPARGERHALQRILNARIVNVPTKAQREAMKLGFDALLRDLANGIKRPCPGAIDDDV